MSNSARKTALITGASEGIGLELSRIFAREGYDLVLVARNREKLDELGEQLSASCGVSVKVIPKDLSARSAPDEIYEEVAESGITVDTLVNNAGYTIYGPFAENDFDEESKMLEVLIWAPTRLAKLFLPDMVKKGRGRILNTASTGSFIPCPNEALYCAGKAYLLFLSEAIAEELVGTGVTVTALCPGATRTRFFERSSTENLRVAKVGSMSAEQVAEIGYQALTSRRRYVVAGMQNKLLVWSTRLMPRRLLVKVTKYAMR
jgi:short-subunit dehydrogenase